MSVYPVERIQSLSKVRGVFGGGGWLNRPAEAGPFTTLAFNMLEGTVKALILPTPTSEPCDEVDLLRESLPALSRVEISPLGEKQTWPDAAALQKAVKWANFVAIPGGNFPDYMSKVTGPVGEALKDKFLSGKAVFVGASNGTVSWFDQVHTADRPSSQGGGTNADYRLEPGLGALPGLVCAHFNERNEHKPHRARATAFEKAVKTQPRGTVAFGVDTQAALVIENGKVRCYTRDRYAHVLIIKSLGKGKLDYIRLTQSAGDLSLEEVYAV